MTMRVPGWVLMLVAAGGCTTNQLHLEERSVLQSRTSSMVLYDDGVVGHGSMNEQTCKVDTFAGMIINDTDLPTAYERIEDARGEVAVALSTEGIHVLDENGWDQPNDIALDGVLFTRMTEDGVASLVADDDGCRVDWRNDDMNEVVELGADVCANADSFAVNPATGQTWVAYGTDIVSAQLGQTASSSAGIPGDVMAFDEASGALFVATLGGSEISALDASGNLLWSEDVKGAVTSMSDMGGMGAAGAVVSTDGGVAFRVLDGIGGSSLADYPLPEEADLVVSSDAGTVAFVTPEFVRFYGVFEGPTAISFNEVDTQPPPMFGD
jgi:hypothetical protein